MLYHMFLLLWGTTTWEHSRYDTIDYMKVFPKGNYPFNYGVWGNLKLACCHGGNTRYAFFCELSY